MMNIEDPQNGKGDEIDLQIYSADTLARTRTNEEIPAAVTSTTINHTSDTHFDATIQLIAELRGIMAQYGLSQAEVCRYTNFSGGQAALSIWLSGKHVSKQEMKEDQIRTFLVNVQNGTIIIPPQLTSLGDKRFRRRGHENENPSIE
jgi:hypothetical protein